LIENPHAGPSDDRLVDLPGDPPVGRIADLHDGLLSGPAGGLRGDSPDDPSVGLRVDLLGEYR
jgi:hypothetical protein